MFTQQVLRIVVFSLAGLLVTLAIYTSSIYIERNKAVGDLKTEKANYLVLEADKQKALSATKSCETSFSKFKEKLEKKEVVITDYKKEIQRGDNNNEVSSLDDYINFANRLQLQN